MAYKDEKLKGVIDKCNSLGEWQEGSEIGNDNGNEEGREDLIGTFKIELIFTNWMQRKASMKDDIFERYQ